MCLNLSDRPTILFGVGLKLLSLRFQALQLGEDDLARALEDAGAEIDRLLEEYQEEKGWPVANEDGEEAVVSVPPDI
ncbi:hypothetical protein [Rhizobium oryzicola]|uniref:Uncharacterized protein n=1 Tax=Rhizobium oryzicola TaxID=1232668 RepID=A0ABT8SVU9_9HYPH|nr:hypothetical protein [Rhizobium oryzicola]MDO1582451.1 hypothetical protein [Rhizobium oryzicola]